MTNQVKFTQADRHLWKRMAAERGLKLRWWAGILYIYYVDTGKFALDLELAYEDHVSVLGALEEFPVLSAGGE